MIPAIKPTTNIVAFRTSAMDKTLRCPSESVFASQGQLIQFLPAPLIYFPSTG